MFVKLLLAISPFGIRCEHQVCAKTAPATFLILKRGYLTQVVVITVVKPTGPDWKKTENCQNCACHVCCPPNPLASLSTCVEFEILRLRNYFSHFLDPGNLPH